MGPFFVLAHQAAIARDIGDQNRGQLPLELSAASTAALCLKLGPVSYGGRRSGASRGALGGSHGDLLWAQQRLPAFSQSRSRIAVHEQKSCLLKPLSWMF